MNSRFPADSVVNLGAFSITGHTVVDTPIDIHSECEISGKLCSYLLHIIHYLIILNFCTDSYNHCHEGPIMKGKKPMGQIKLRCKVEIGDTWDWVVQEYKRSEVIQNS